MALRARPGGPSLKHVSCRQTARAAPAARAGRRVLAGERAGSSPRTRGLEDASEPGAGRVRVVHVCGTFGTLWHCRGGLLWDTGRLAPVFLAKFCMVGAEVE